MDIEGYLAERRALVDRRLDEVVPAAGTPPGALHAAMRHLLFPGGKRLRPALAFAAAEAAGAPPERALPVAAAVELVHTYSLIHDDLPCMDDDRERRGRPTVHVAFGEALAVLAGDALLASAFEALGTGAPEQAAPAEVVSAAAAEVARAAGSLGLVGGQADDLAFEPGSADVEAVESVHRRKTAALFAAAVCGGARFAGAGSDALDRFRRFGERLGVAFQIRDDLLDAGSDDASCSLLAPLDAGRAAERADALIAEALEALEPFGERAGPLRELARFAVRRKR